MTLDEFLCVMKNLNKNENELLNSYDAIFHLVSAADGAA